MKILILFLLVFAATNSHSKPTLKKHPKDLYERLYGKCSNVRDFNRHPEQLFYQYRSCSSVDHPDMYLTSCSGNLKGGRDLQYFQFKKSNCKAK